MLRHRAYTPWYLVRYWRFPLFKLRNPHVITRGFVFLDRGVELYAPPRLRPADPRPVGAPRRQHRAALPRGHADAWATRACSAATCRSTATSTSRSATAALIADNVYISDFDHKFADLEQPIKDQGIAKSRVRIEPDVWLGTKVTVARGVVIGEGAVVGANAVVTRDLPAYAVAVGVPARVIKDRRAAR